MASLAQAVVNTSLTALRLVRQFLSMPVIVYTPQPKYGIAQPSITIFLEVTSFREILPAQASKMLLVDVSQGKSFVNDNIAPMPRTWELEGFVFPVAPIIPATDQIQVEVIKQSLRDASRSRQTVQFKPVATDIGSQFFQAFNSIMATAANGGMLTITGTLPVVIVDLEFETRADVQNKGPVKMTLQQMDTLSAYSSQAASVTQSPDGSLSNPYASPASNNLGVSTYTSAPTSIAGAVP